MKDIDLARRISRVTCARTALLLLWGLVAVFGGSWTWAQASSGTITGLVTDPKGDVIPGAQVTVTSSAGNFTTQTKTSNEGVYEVPAVPPGSYLLKIHSPGFNTKNISGINVSVGGITQVDAKLDLGATTEVVTVTAEGELLNTSSATLQTTIEKEVLTDLPFPERNVLAAVLFAPGVTGDPQTNDGVGSELPNAYNGPIAPGAGLTIGGSRQGMNPQLVDGSDLTLAGFPRTGVTFSGDAIQSVSVQSIGLPAQYGRSGGGVINQGSRAGTSKYHGALRWRHRDPAFMIPARGSGGAPPNEHLNLFTIAVGGPVPLPFHKNKTFFFFAYEPLRNTSATYTRKRFLTPDEIAGRFNNSFDLLDQTILRNQGYAAAVNAPRTGAVVYQFARNAQGFPVGNRLPVAQYQRAANNDISQQAAANPITKFLLASQPTPDQSTSYARFFYPDGHYDPDGMNGYGVRGVTTNDDRYSLRVDENLTAKDRIFVRYTNVPVSGIRYDYNGPSTPVLNQPSESVNGWNVSANYVRTVKATMVNEFRATYLRSDDSLTPAPASLTKDFNTGLGLPPSIRGEGLAGFIFSNNLTTLGQSVGFGKILNETYGFGDDYSMLMGRHSIKFGVDYRALQLNRYDETNLYGGSFTCNTGLTNGAGFTGSSCVAGYMLGLFNTFTVNTPHAYYYRWKYGAAYVQDDWRILPRLTINVGLRYNIETPRMEKFNYQGSFISNGTGTLNGVATTGGFAFSGTNGLPTTMWPINYKGLEPRLGLAYQPARFMTMRASYAMMHTPLTGLGNNIVPNLTSGAATTGTNGVGGVGSGWVNLITNPIANAAPPAAPVVSNTLLESWNGTSYLPAVNQSSAAPYVQLWSASLQFQLGKGTLVEADYVGQKGTHLYSTPVPVNVPSINAITAAIKSRANLITASKDQYGNTSTALQRMKPYPQFFQNSIYTAYDRNAGSNYNALYLSGRQQMKFGLSLFASFSWSKSLDDASSGQGGPGDTQIDAYGYLYPQGYTTAGDYSLSAFDVPVHLSIGEVWNLPFGRGKTFFSNSSRWLDAVIGGWNLSTTTSMQSGYPLSIVAGVNGRSAGFFCSTSRPFVPGASNNPTPCDYGNALTDVSVRPNRVPGVPLIKPDWKRDPLGTTIGGGILNPNAFSMPGSLDNPAFGNVPRTMGDARNPRSIISNATLRKRFDLSESRVKLELWTDVINVMNHTNYYLLNNSPAIHGAFSTIRSDGTFAQNASFGLANAQAPGMRQFNLGIALTF
ncbi:TonB-dependent receptor [Terriglobus albidus]|uniref:TonB-dependent receptor n=1 Tax=Terriglobus albidus TaxID=1592106 RepID=A0A5B9E8E5_9BACT|nr:TonB-dependent receptor [Terriglobus albidus]